MAGLRRSKIIVESKYYDTPTSVELKFKLGCDNKNNQQQQQQAGYKLDIKLADSIHERGQNVSVYMQIQLFIRMRKIFVQSDYYRVINNNCQRV